MVFYRFFFPSVIAIVSTPDETSPMVEENGVSIGCRYRYRSIKREVSVLERRTGVRFVVESTVTLGYEVRD